MSGKLSYKEYKSLGQGVTGRFPQADDQVNPAVMSSRRPHIKAYLTYMLPTVVAQHGKWLKEAIEFVAASYDKKGLKAVPTETFDYQVDRRVFKVFFTTIKSYNKFYVAPDWPWSISDVVAAGDGAPKASSAYWDYLHRNNAMAARIDRILGPASTFLPGPRFCHGPTKGVTTGGDSTIPPSAASSSTLGPAKGLKDSIFYGLKSVVSVETLKGEMQPGQNLKESIKTLWRQYRGVDAITGPVVAPFTLELETFIPDIMVSEYDVTRINELLWCCELVFRLNKRLLSVKFLAGHGPSPQRSRVEFLKTWSAIKSWLKKVYAMSPITLYEYFQYTQMIGIDGHSEGPHEFLISKIRIDENYGAAQETIARGLAMRNEVKVEVQKLITSDFNETDRALSQWILSRPTDERLICAGIAAWDWLNRCDTSLFQKVEQWGGNAINKHRNPSTDENVIE